MNTSPEVKKSVELSFTVRVLIMVLVWAMFAFAGAFETEKDLVKTLVFYVIVGGVSIPPPERLFKDTPFMLKYVLFCVIISAILDGVLSFFYPA